MTILRFTEFEWFILESSQNLTANSKVDSRNVAQGNIKNVSDDLKQRLIANRKPRKGFEFPAREYMDHCRSDGKMNHYCNPEWFDTYKFLAYSGQEVGVYCLSCILFLTQPKNGSRTAKLIITPYTDWRKATDYLFSHADECEYHKTSFNRFDAVLYTQNNPSIRIDQRMTNNASNTLKKTDEFWSRF